ncbi:hypothetical protein [Granulicella arctica]|uniref:hypothetical protein n=1 Tax=Granulicella arctica TaxID=940613 RepID=UPI0021E05D0B|nr:hypothetical protein [Granulicella arctica]
MSRVTIAALLVLTATMPAFASRHSHGDNGRVSFGHDVTIDEGETADDIVCVFCSVHAHGDIEGDVAVVFGSVDVDANHTISGDVAVVGGDVSAGDDATIHGDLAVVAGELRLAPNATVHGDKTVVEGRGWLLVALAPLLILIGIIWLIVWLVRRNRYPYPPRR